MSLAAFLTPSRCMLINIVGGVIVLGALAWIVMRILAMEEVNKRVQNAMLVMQANISEVETRLIANAAAPRPQPPALAEASRPQPPQVLPAERQEPEYRPQSPRQPREDEHEPEAVTAAQLQLLLSQVSENIHDEAEATTVL